MRKQKRTTIREKVAETMELPKEIAISMPKITLYAAKEATVENYKGVIELSPENVRLYTAAGVVSLSGEALDISAITDEDITILGCIRKIELE